MKSKLALFFCACILLFCGTVFVPRWQNAQGEAQLSWDAGGYYWYLPSAFIYKDLKGQSFHDSVMRKYQPTPPDDFRYAYKHASGNYVIRYTMGMALLELPFFTVAHISATYLGYPADGFSKPYQFMIFAGAMLFVCTGLWYLRRLLLYYYSDSVVATVLLLLVIGTSYLNYASMDVGMTHCWLFSLYVFILYNTHHYYRTLKLKYALRTGVLIGLAALVRPPEIIAAFIPLLWGMEKVNRATIREKLNFIRLHNKAFLSAVLLAALVIFPQFLYWKYATGSWFVYTYQDQGFSWLSPRFGQYTFNYQCGWLVYTPIMFAALAGIVPFVRSGRNKVAILFLIVINYYIVASWDGWDYGGRAMVQGYALLLFPLASLIKLMYSKPLLTWLLSPVLLLFSYVNIWWTYQAHKEGLTAGIPSTGSYFWATILRYNLPVEVQKLRDNPYSYTGTVTSPDLLYSNNFMENGRDSMLVLGKDKPQSAIYTFPKPGKNYRWLRASADIHIDDREGNVWFMTHFVVRFSKNGKVVATNSIRLQRLLEANTTRNIFIDARMDQQDFDQVEILFNNENNGATRCVIDNLKVIGFNG